VPADPVLLPDLHAEAQRVVRCADCHRPLRDAASRAAGRGPGCRHQDPPRRYDVDQDALPGL
jgi:hypothetical protein